MSKTEIMQEYARIRREVEVTGDGFNVGAWYEEPERNTGPCPFVDKEEVRMWIEAWASGAVFDLLARMGQFPTH
jgi:hypothetical protein